MNHVVNGCDGPAGRRGAARRRCCTWGSPARPNPSHPCGARAWRAPAGGWTLTRTLTRTPTRTLTWRGRRLLH
eukprot:1183784-Prorocentrum_minimum.AAC.3